MELQTNKQTTHTHTHHIPTLPLSPLLALAAASNGHSILATWSIETIFIATDAPFQGTFNECRFVALASVLTKQRATGFHSWLWRFFSAGPATSIGHSVLSA